MLETENLSLTPKWDVKNSLETQNPLSPTWYILVSISAG